MKSTSMTSPRIHESLIHGGQAGGRARRRLRASAAILALVGSAGACTDVSDTDPAARAPSDEDLASESVALHNATSVRNLKNFLNLGGTAATSSTQGDLDLTNAFHTAQGTNGRSCGTCHLPDGGWSITPLQVELRFLLTAGTDPLFLPLDANSPTADVSTPEARKQSYSKLRSGLFRRGGTPPATRDFDILAAEDPHGYGSADPQRFSVFRRPLATANFHLAKNVGWDDSNTRSGQTVPAGLFAQAANNIVTGQAGTTPETTTVDGMVAYESALSFAQTRTWKAGRLDADGARGGPAFLAQQTLVNARFNLFDAWIGSTSKARASIARGQEIFNTKTRPTGGGACRGCHNAENNGSNVNGTLFNIGASDERWASVDDLPIYTVKNRVTGDEIRTTDPGKANRSGSWADMNRFKVPSLRGLTARAPFLHNGVAKNLREVVTFYEESMGFEYTPEEEDDLVNFMNAL